MDHYHSVDSTILIELVTNAHQKSRESILSLLYSTYNASYFVDDLTVVETVNALEHTHNYTRKYIREALMSLFATPFFTIDAEFFEKVFKDYVSHPKLPFSTCYLTQNAKAKGVTPIYTTNPQLLKATNLAKSPN